VVVDVVVRHNICLLLRHAFVHRDMLNLSEHFVSSVVAGGAVLSVLTSCR